MLERISAAAARRTAIAAQGLADPRPTGRVDRRHLRRLVERVGLIQIDSVNVVARSQELVLFARLGPHPRSLIAEATAAGELFEYWAHEASHLPTSAHRLLRWKMASDHRWGITASLVRDEPGLIEEIYGHVVEHGPIAAGAVSRRVGPKSTWPDSTWPDSKWWDWDHGKRALEALFWSGRVTARRRASDFARLYDLPERMLPAAVLDAPTPSTADARKELLVLAAASMGVATFGDLIDYHRQHAGTCRALVAELVEEGRLVPVAVEGWQQPAYARPTLRIPRRVQARALLSPFDSMVWNRERVERLFGFRYRIEIYVPRERRAHGYYVLPFLLGDRLVGRVDLKADRQTGTLLVQSAWAEPSGEPDPATVAVELAAELRSMAGWLGLDDVVVRPQGDLAAELAAAVDAGTGSTVGSVAGAAAGSAAS